MTELELQYDYCMQSVNKIIQIKSKTIKSEIDTLDLESNIDYLTQMLNESFWTNEDLTPLRNAVV